MRVFLGPARTSSLREDGKEITQLLGATKFCLSHLDTHAHPDHLLFDGPGVDTWEDALPQGPFGILVMFDCSVALYFEAGVQSFPLDVRDLTEGNIWMKFERAVPAPFLPTQLL